MKNIINIGREYASGGRQIGEMLAKRLGFAFFDKELISLAAKESGLCTEFYETVDEKKHFGFLNGFFCEAAPNTNFGDNYINSEVLFKIQSDVIRSLAEKQDCVFVGRGSDYILRDNPNCLNVFISARLEDRENRLKERNELKPEKNLRDFLEKTDKKRADFYNYYTNKIWGKASSYHLCINSSLLGIDQSVDTICNIAKLRFKIN